MTEATLHPAMRRRLERNIVRFYAYQFACNLALWAPIWVLYLQHQRGLSLTRITALDAPFWLIALVAEVPTGTVADRWGRKASLLLGAASYALGLFLFGIAENYPLLLLSYLAWPVSIALQSGADSAFLFDSLRMLGREGEFRKVLGRSNAIHSIGFLLGGLIGAPLAAATSLAFPIIATAAIALLGVLAALSFTEPRHESDAAPLPYMTTMKTAIHFAVQHTGVRWMIAVRAMVMGAGLIAIIFTQPYLASFDVPVSQFGLITTPLGLLGIGGSLITYWLVARLGERNLLIGLGIGVVGALLVVGLVPALAAFSMFGVIAFCRAATGTVSSDFINRHSPQQLRATVASVGQMVISLALLIGEPLLGLLADRTSLQTMFLVSGIVIGLLTAVSLAGWILATRTERHSGATLEPAVAVE